MAAPLISPITFGDATVNTLVDFTETYGSNAYGATMPRLLLNDHTGNLGFSFTAQSSGWLRLIPTVSRQVSDMPMWSLCSGTTQILRQKTTNTLSGVGSSQFEYWNGSAWVAIGAVFGSNPGMVDIQWVLHGTTGAFRMYVDGALLREYTGNTIFGGVTTFNNLELRACTTSASTYPTSYHHIIVDTVDTRGLFWSYDTIAADGFHTSMTNGRTQAAVYPHQTNGSTSFLIADADGETDTFTCNAPNTSLSTTGAIEKIAICTWGKALSDPGYYLKPILRKSGTDYTPAASVQPLSSKDISYSYQTALDPSTGAPFADVTALQAFEIGWRASAAA